MGGASHGRMLTPEVRSRTDALPTMAPECNKGAFNVFKQCLPALTITRGPKLMHPGSVLHVPISESLAVMPS